MLEFDLHRLETDPMAITQLLMNGREALKQAEEKFELKRIQNMGVKINSLDEAFENSELLGKEKMDLETGEINYVGQELPKIKPRKKDVFLDMKIRK